MVTAIDLFAGAGGFSEGARSAGVNVLWAGNHWPLAVQYHAANHPETIHLCQDLHQAVWPNVPAHDLLLASPCCQGHSHARGKDRPGHDAARSTAWAVVSCLEFHRPAAAIIENVKAYLDWILYPAWVDALNRLGYSVSPHLLDAADHGVPQNRERLFLVCTKSRKPLVLDIPKKEHVPVRSVIEWDAHDWSPINKPNRSSATLARIENAIARGLGNEFVCPFYSNGSGKTGRSIDRPLGVVSTLDRWLLVSLSRRAKSGEQGVLRMFQPSELRAIMGFRKDYALPPTRREAIMLLGNAVAPPQAADVISAVCQAA